MSPRVVIGSVIVALAVTSTVRVAAAEREIVIDTPGERTRENKLLLAGLAGAGVLAGGLGLYWHLDSRSASREVSAKELTGKAWTSDRQALVEQADRSRTRAAIAYGIGGALVVSAVVALIVTEPPSERTVIHPRSATPTVAPIQGGAVVGGAWSF